MQNLEALKDTVVLKRIKQEVRGGTGIAGVVSPVSPKDSTYRSLREQKELGVINMIVTRGKNSADKKDLKADSSQESPDKDLLNRNQASASPEMDRSLPRGNQLDQTDNSRGREASANLDAAAAEPGSTETANMPESVLPLDEHRLFTVISEQLKDVDEQLALKKIQLATKEKAKDNVQRLQHSVRDWLKETRL